MVRSLSYRNKTVWNSLLKTYVRPHLEYCVQVWNPWLVKDKEILEKIQKRAITLTFGLSGSTYEEKLKELGLISLENKKKRGDLIQVWIILHGHDYVDKNKWFSSAYVPEEGRGIQTRQSKDPLNLKVLVVKTEIYRNFFSTRCVNMWNEIPQDVKNAKNLNIFKNKLEEWLNY